VFLRIKQTA